MRRIPGSNLSTKFRELGFPFDGVRNTGLAHQVSDVSAMAAHSGAKR